MSKENKNIDQLFSDAALSEKAPHYDSAYWAEMNTMLNARDAKKRAFIFWAIGGSAAFAVLFISLFTLNMDNSLEEKRYVSEELNLNIENINLSERMISSPERVGGNLNIERNSLNQTEVKGEVLANKQNQTKTQTDRQNDHEFLFQNNVKELATIVDNVSNSNDARNEQRPSPEIDKTEVNLELSLPLIAVYQLTQRNTAEIVRSTFNLKESPKYTLYTKFSGGLMENYKTSRPYESGLFDLSLNLEINMNHVLFRTGLGTQLTTNADLIVSQRKEINEIIVVKLQKDLSYQSLVDIYIPIEFGYQLNNTSFGVGAQVNYLLTTSMDLNNYENKVLVNTEKQYRNKDGLNKFSTQGYLWIEQRFTPMISLGLKTGTNISGRIKDGAYFNESATTNPIYGQISLKVDLIR